MKTSDASAAVVDDDAPTSDQRARVTAPDMVPTRSIAVWRSGWTWLAAAVVTFGRWLEAADRRMFHLAPDEPGQLAMARWMAGATRWNMFDHLTWRPGYALTLAPFAWVVEGGEALVRAALTLNAVFAGLACVCLTVLVHRWTDLGVRSAAGVSALVALAPSAISSSAHVWAESLITLVFLLTLVALQAVVDRPSTWAGVTAVVVAAFAMTVHGRLLPVLPVTAVIVVTVLVVDGRWKQATAIGGLATILWFASLRFTDWVLTSVWDEPSDANSAGSVISRLDGPAALFDALAGQFWYQLVASVGLVGIGVGIVLIALVRPQGRMRRVDAAVVLALTTPLVATSIAFMAGRDRPDQLVYGRYIDAVVWPFAALGLAWTLRRLRPLAPPSRSVLPVVVAIMTVVLGIIVAARHGDDLADSVGLRAMVPGLLPYIGSADGVPVMTITIVAAVVVAALAVVAAVPNHHRVPRSLLLVAAVGIIGWSGVRVHDAQTTYLNDWAIGADLSEVDTLVPDGDRIGVVMSRDAIRPSWTVQRQRFQVYQLYLPGHEFVWERIPATATTQFVFAPIRLRELSGAGYRIRWRDPVKPMALWERSPRADDRVESSTPQE